MRMGRKSVVKRMKCTKCFKNDADMATGMCLDCSFNDDFALE